MIDSHSISVIILFFLFAAMHINLFQILLQSSVTDFSWSFNSSSSYIFSIFSSSDSSHYVSFLSYINAYDI